MPPIDKIRQEIDQIDEKIIWLLSERFKKSLEIVEEKRKKGLPIFDKIREEELFEKIQKKAKKQGLSPERAKKIFLIIVHESRKAQEIRSA